MNVPEATCLYERVLVPSTEEVSSDLGFSGLPGLSDLLTRESSCAKGTKQPYRTDGSGDRRHLLGPIWSRHFHTFLHV